MNNVNWANPYQDRDGTWLKGNLHIHTNSPKATSACGKVPPEQMVELYKKHGYDFISISDHGTLTLVPADGLITIPGTEWNSAAGEHTGIYGLDTKVIEKALTIEGQPALLEYLSGTDALVIINHPNWQSIPHYRREALDKLAFLDGIEIYNSVITRLAGTAVATDKWDYLLEGGRKVLGFAAEDAHYEDEVGRAWNMVRAGERNPEGVMAGIQAGNFYCSTGVTVVDIRKNGSTLEIETEDAQEIRVISTGGRMLHKVIDKGLSFNYTGTDASYIRFTCYGMGSQLAWTQPFFINDNN